MGSGELIVFPTCLRIIPYGSHNIQYADVNLKFILLSNWNFSKMIIETKNGVVLYSILLRELLNLSEYKKIITPIDFINLSLIEPMKRDLMNTIVLHQLQLYWFPFDCKDGVCIGSVQMNK